MSRIRTRASRRSIRSAASGLSLSDDWRAWVGENAARGVARGELIAALVAGEVPASVAVREVDLILRSPALVACARLAARASRRDLVLSLQRELQAMAPRAGEIERRPSVPADELFRHYWAPSRPVVLTDVTARWPALERWTPASLKERFGHLDVQVMATRDADPRCDENFEAHRRTIRFAEYVDLVVAGSGNDVYLVAHNGLVDRPGFESLLDDVVPDETIFDTARLRPGGASFWFGAAGTRTPLHHDTTNILFCQIHGRKRLRLVAPNEAELLDRARGYYAELDIDDPAFPAVLVREVVLAPGEALFLPAGWWHQVVALETSISFSLLAFRRPNAFTWYRPGFSPEPPLRAP